MPETDILILSSIAFLKFLFFGFAAILCFYEKEKRAGIIFVVLAAGVLLISFFYYQTHLHLIPSLNYALIGFVTIVFLIFFLPINPVNKHSKPETDGPEARYDERDVMFSRVKYHKGDGRYEAYYKLRPENQTVDDKIRDLPGLLSKEGIYYDDQLFPLASSIFEVVETLHPYVEGVPADEKQKPLTSNVITNWLIQNGATSAGVANMKPWHWYSHRGRGDLFGEEVDLSHPFGIALTFEMDREANKLAPFAPTTVESSMQYFNTGLLCVQLAQIIRSMGYNARAHIDGNYQVVCPIVARSAGLGEIGRMGLLMTPHHGPRVRIGVVTTDMPLQPSEYKPDTNVLDFCNRCKKCAVNCPSNAIQHGNRQKTGSINRWKINHEVCFSYWCKTGTDCGICMAVCPYSHSNNLLHKITRFAINNNMFFRRVAVRFDDWLYGKMHNTKQT